MPDVQSQLPLADDFTEEYLTYHGVLPLHVAAGVLRVAISGDPDPEVLDDLARTYGARIETVAIPEDQLADTIRRCFASASSMVEVLDTLTDGAAADDGLAHETTDARAAASQPPVIRLVNLLLRDAHEAGASDIHLDATMQGLRIRLRLDGMLHELPAPPASLQAAIVSRIKLLAEMDIAERRLPQDGRIRVRLEAKELDLRVSTVPTLFGESVVLRLLDRGGRPVSLAELGMGGVTLQRFERLAGRPHGIVLATGPTGSGKTTTLYAALSTRKLHEEKVITVEDPVEYHLPGVTQVPVHVKAGVTFATALRSILRQDPDVMMVGEMRDRETCAIAVQAAMTGHLVLSTLHTNDAVSGLTRMLDLGVEGYMIAATVEGILAQRLVRRVCDQCRAPYEPEAAAIALVAQGDVTLETVPSRYEHGAGCGACRNTGFRGRIGVFELLVMSDALRQALVRGADVAQLRHLAAKEGLVHLRLDGLAKVRTGLTTIEEVARVVQA